MIHGIPLPGEHDLATVITNWSIKEVIHGANEEPTHHLVGYIPGQWSGRTSSAIQNFDKEKMMITTSSGRVYKLEGMPGRTNDGDYVWDYWKSFNKARNEKDVTSEYWTDT